VIKEVVIQINISCQYITIYLVNSNIRIIVLLYSYNKLSNENGVKTS